MRERVETLGGTLHAGPRPGAGWSVLATVPVDLGRPR
jgi:signal transduction histidine kinase